MARKLNIDYPVLGVDVGGPLESQPALTSPDALNARPYDPLNERQRGSQRAGVVLVDDLGKTDRVDALSVENIARRSYGDGFVAFQDDFFWTSGTPSAVANLGNATGEFITDSADPNYTIGVGVRDTVAGLWSASLTYAKHEVVFRPRVNHSGVSAKFGSSVDYDAASGTLVVGASAMECEPAGALCGQVYVYERVSGHHVLKQRIAPPEGEDEPEGFGASVAISGDWLFVGAPGSSVESVMNDGQSQRAGAVYVYHKVGGVWRHAQTLTAPTPFSNAAFGAAVDLLGAVAAVSEVKRQPTPGTADAGVHIYFLTGTTWTLVETLTGSGDNMFGNDLELHFDGTDTWLVVGEPGPYTVSPFAASSSYAGKAYIHKLVGTSFSLQATLDGSTSVGGAIKGASSLFGFSVSMHGTRVAVGAPAASTSGALNIFVLSAGSWTYEDQVATGRVFNGVNVRLQEDKALVADNDRWFFANRSGASWSISDEGMFGETDVPFAPYSKRCFFIKDDILGAATNTDFVSINIYVGNNAAVAPKLTNHLNGVVVDEQSYASDRVIQYFCYFLESFAGEVQLTPNYRVRIDFKTSSTLAHAYVGLLVSGEANNVAAGSDLPTIAGIAIDPSGTAVPSIGISHFGACAGLLRVDSVKLEKGRSYRLSLDVVGSEGTLRLHDFTTGEETFLAYAPNIRRTNAGSSFTQSDVGFVLGGVGQAGGEGLEYVDRFTIDKCSRVHSEKDTLVVSAAGRDIRVYDRGLKMAIEPYGGRGAVRKGPLSLVGGPVDSTGRRRHVAILDGSTYQTLDLDNLIVSPWVASPSKGSLPVSTVDNFAACKHAVLYRNAIVLFGLEGHEANWFMSRRGDMFDWLYTPAFPDGNQAVSGDVSDAGPLPEPITALAPHHGDYMIMASLRRQWVMRGHPNIGGVIDTLSSSSGILTHEAWTVDPDGRLYTMGLDGLYVMAPPISEPVRLSHGRLGRRLRELDPSQNRVILEWSATFDGLWAIIAPLGDGECTVWWWDRRTGLSQQGVYGFWPDKYPAHVGPYTAATGVDPTTGKDAIYYGGKGGVYVVDREATDDAGTPIISYVVFQPLIADTQTRIQLSELRLKLAEQADSVEYEVRAAESAEAVLGVDPAYTHTEVDSGKIRTETRRVQGGAISVKVGRNLSSDTREHTKGRWAIESVAGKAEPLGPIKRKGAL